MPLTKLDNTTALIVIDLQKGLAGLTAAHRVGEMVGRAAQLAQAFRESGLPVVLVKVTGAAPARTDAGLPKFALPADWTELVPELEQASNDYLAAKPYDLGYNVALAVDAMTDRDGDAHRHSVEKIFPRLGETDTTDNVLKLLKAAGSSEAV